MARYSIAAVVALVYAAGAIWFVREEGRAYRESLRQSRLAARPAAVPAPAPGHAPTPTPAPAKRVERHVASAAIPKPGASRPPAPRRKPVVPVPSVAPARVAEEAKEAAPAAPRDPLWDSPAMKEVWDPARLGPEEEARLGRALHDLIVRFNPPLTTGPWLRRVKEAASPLLDGRLRKEINYTFTILDSDVVNAFSHPGGYIYINRGLFDLIGEDEDAALRFVLGHEIAHVDRRDALACLRDPGVQATKLGTLPLLYTLILPWGYYPDDLDYKADTWAFEQLMRQGATRHEALSFLRKLEGYARIQGFENGRMPPKPAAESALIENHLRAHPAAWERLEKLRKLSAAFAPAAAQPRAKATPKPSR